MRKLVMTPTQVVGNIQRFAKELPGSSEMQSRLGQVHDWYAIRQSGQVWVFGPSKFVGYRDNTINRYLETYRVDANGGETERALAPLSRAVDPGSPLQRELMSALEGFLDQWGRKPRRGSQIRLVVQVESDIRIGAKQSFSDALLDRITSAPEICGGRPCIKGTRMRVVDIIEAIAHGVSQEELLRDFDYLTADDIAAALHYAGRAADHRVIETA